MVDTKARDCASSPLKVAEALNEKRGEAEPGRSIRPRGTYTISSCSDVLVGGPTRRRSFLEGRRQTGSIPARHSPASSIESGSNDGIVAPLSGLR